MQRKFHSQRNCGFGGVLVKNLQVGLKLRREVRVRAVHFSQPLTSGNEFMEEKKVKEKKTEYETRENYLQFSERKRGADEEEKW